MAIKEVKLSPILIFLCLTFYVSTVWGDWVQDGGSLNVDSSQSACEPAIAISNGTPYVTWSETHQVYVKHYDGNNWIQDGGSLNVNPSQITDESAIAIFNGTPYVTWLESNGTTMQIYVKHYTGSSWKHVSGSEESLNVNPSSVYDSAHKPAIAISNGTPYVAWQESWYNGKIYVKYYTGSSWKHVSESEESLNVNPSQVAHYPAIAISNGTPYATWQEGGGIAEQIYVKHYDGSSWIQDGGSLNVNMIPNHHAYHPAIAISNGTPYVTWFEYNTIINQIYVKHYNGSNWVQDGGSLNVNSSSHGWQNPTIAIYNGTAYVTWCDESNGSIEQIYVKYYDGSSWKHVSGSEESLNINPSQYARDPVIAISKGTPYVTWYESGQIYVKHYIIYLASISPHYSLPGKTLNATIVGTRFLSIPSIKLVRTGSPDIIATSVVANNPNMFSCQFNLNGVSPGVYDVQVETNGVTGSLKHGFFVLNPTLAPLRWVVTDMGQAGTPSLNGTFYGLDIGDGDNDGSQEVFAANLDQKLFMFDKFISGWSSSAFPAATRGGTFSKVVVCDGDNDEEMEVYGSTLDNHVYQFKGAQWTKTDVGIGETGNEKIYCLAQGDGNNDGKKELYAACENGRIYQFKKNDPWDRSDVGSGEGSSPMYAVAVGDGNSDGAFEVYGASADHKIYQFKYNGSAWTRSEVGSGAGEMYGLTIGDGDRDEKLEVYGANQDGKIYQYEWQVSSWLPTEVGSSGKQMHSVVISDGDNNGQDEIYCACGDGNIYQFAWENSKWTKLSLGGSSQNPLYAVTVGDGDNDNRFEVYAIGLDNQVYQYKAESISTPVSPIPKAYFKIYNSQINPIRGEQASIRWSQPQTGPVIITIYNLLGNKIITLVDKRIYPEGQYHEVLWNGRNQRGSPVGSGIYLVHIKAGDNENHGKIAVVK